MKLTQLSHLAEIRAGITFRTSSESNRSVSEGMYSLVQIGDLTNEGEIRAESNFCRLSPAETFDPRMILHAGDILFPARGTRTTAAVYRENPPAPAVVGSQFFVIRLQREELCPEYLAWYFTTAAARQYFDTRRAGSHVQFVSRGTLAEFPVPIPPMETQHRVARLSQLLHSEQQLINRLHEKRRLLLETKLLQSLSPSKS